MESHRSRAWRPFDLSGAFLLVGTFLTITAVVLLSFLLAPGQNSDRGMEVGQSGRRGSAVCAAAIDMHLLEQAPEAAQLPNRGLVGPRYGRVVQRAKANELSDRHTRAGGQRAQLLFLVGRDTNV